MSRELHEDLIDALEYEGPFPLLTELRELLLGKSNEAQEQGYGALAIAWEGVANALDNAIEASRGINS